MANSAGVAYFTTLFRKLLVGALLTLKVKATKKLLENRTRKQGTASVIPLDIPHAFESPLERLVSVLQGKQLVF